MSTEPALRTLTHRDILPQTAMVTGSLMSATAFSVYALAAGQMGLFLVSLIALTGPLVGLKHVDNKARELEGSDA